MLQTKIANPYEYELNFAQLKAAAQAVLQGEGALDAKVIIAFVNNEHMHRLNKQFLNHDEPTDVLTFPYSAPGAKKLEGEIVICYEIAIEYAADRGHAVDLELLLYVIHGCLHLCGYDDQTPKEIAEMRRAEEHYLGELGLPNISGE